MGDINTEDTNIKIAEFVGRKGKHHKGLYWVNVPGVKWVSPKEMMFHKCWNWLMVPIHKISEDRNTREFMLMNPSLDRDFGESLKRADIDLSYKAVLVIILKHNK